MTHSTLRNVLRDRGGFISVSQHDTAGVIDHVPAYVYDVSFNENIGLMLVRDRANFDVGERKYGNHRKWYNIVTSRYDRENPSLGVIMMGYKGLGKSFLAEDICNWGLRQGLPVLFINQKLPVGLIHGAISSIGPCIVYFDEFGKSYRSGTDKESENDRDKMITLFSDTSHKGVMFIVTGNHKHEFSDFMIDRPGRFEYRFNFDMLSVSVAAEIADEYKLSPEMRDLLLRHTYHRTSSYDIITKMAAVLRRHKSLDEAIDEISVLNVPDLAWYSHSIQEVLYHGVKHSKSHLSFECKEDNILELTIRDREYQELESFTIDLMNPSATLITAYQSNAKDYLPLGMYSIKVNDHLTIRFFRNVDDLRHSVFCNAQSQEDIDKALESEREQERQREEARAARGGGNTAFRKVVGGEAAGAERARAAG
jgi:hypothetical protein